MERGGEGRERGRQVFGFLTWAGLGCLHSEAESGKLNYNSSHKERVSWLLLPLGSPAQPLPMSWGPLPRPSQPQPGPCILTGLHFFPASPLPQLTGQLTSVQRGFRSPAGTPGLQFCPLGDDDSQVPSLGITSFGEHT